MSTNTYFYVASGIQNRFYAEAIARYIELEFGGHNLCCSSSWIYDLTPLPVEERARIDFGDIDRSKFVVAVYPYGKNGTICEMTYAFAKGIPTIYCHNELNQKDIPLICGMFCGQFNNGYIVSQVPQLLKVIREIVRVN